jgi:hypothetical protein
LVFKAVNFFGQKWNALYCVVGSRRAAYAGCVHCSMAYYAEGDKIMKALAAVNEIHPKLDAFWGLTFDTVTALLRKAYPNHFKRPKIAPRVRNISHASGAPPAVKSPAKLAVSVETNSWSLFDTPPAGRPIAVAKSRSPPPPEENYWPNAPICSFGGFKTGPDFPEYRQRLAPPAAGVVVQAVRLIAQVPQAPFCAMAKVALPIEQSSTANAAALGFRRGDKFFASPTIAERAFMVNKHWVPRLHEWKPPSKHRMRVLILHGQALGEYRLTTMDRYRTFETGAKYEAKFVDEEWMDREHFIVYQLYVNYDIASHTTLARVF